MFGVAHGPETECDTFTHIARVTLTYTSPRGHRWPRPTVEARPNAHERAVRHRRPHTRCWAAACATRRMGLMGAQSGWSAAGASAAGAGAHLSLQSLLRHQKEVAQHLRFHVRGDAERAQPSSVSETFPGELF